MIYVNGAIPTFKTAIASAMSLRVNRFSNRPFRVKRFQTNHHHSSVDVAHGLVLLFGIGTKALPSWESKTRRNNLPSGLAVTNGRSKRLGELTSSIVPRGTSFHHWVDLECSPITFDCARFSCSHDLPGPAEVGAVNPDAMHDHSQSACQSHDRLFYPAAPGDLHRPGLEPRPLVGAGQHDLGRFVEHRPHHLISAA